MSPEQRPLAPGQKVVILDLGKPGHVRTPMFVRNRIGTIESYCGAFDNPEDRAYGRIGQSRVPLYRVRFRQRDLWPDYDGPDRDSLTLDIYDHWLRPVGADDIGSGDIGAEDK